MKVALLGSGIMGASMATRLIDAGHQLNVYNRTVEKLKPLEALGASVYSRSNEAVRDCDVCIVILSDINAINDVLDVSCLELLKNKTILMMSTISSNQSKDLLARSSDLDIFYIECPVLGSKKEVAAGTLIVMVGATKEQYEKWESFLSVFGEVNFCGDIGQASTLKLALNHLIAAHAACFSLSLGMVEKGFVDKDLFMKILKSSTLMAPMYEKKLPNWNERNYENPNFPLKHMLKDVNLIIEESENFALRTDTAIAIQKLLNESINDGYEDKDYSAIFNTINGVNAC